LSPKTLKTWSMMICFATVWFSLDLSNEMKSPQATRPAAEIATWS
jgi:hypothetical protein